jgi:nitrogen fixation/metabolism regulation signal transduction histidine kinase
MKQKVLYGLGALLLTVLVGLLVWQGSFSLGDVTPDGPQQVTIFWAVSTLVFLLTVLIGFLLFRSFIKIFLERQQNREGSRLRTKMLVAALGITILPVFFFAVFSVYVLNRNLDKWFSRPAVNANTTLVGMTMALERGAEGEAKAQAELLASRPEVAEYARGNKSLMPVLCGKRDCRGATGGQRRRAIAALFYESYIDTIPDGQGSD